MSNTPDPDLDHQMNEFVWDEVKKDVGDQFKAAMAEGLTGRPLSQEAASFLGGLGLNTEDEIREACEAFARGENVPVRMEGEVLDYQGEPILALLEGEMVFGPESSSAHVEVLRMTRIESGEEGPGDG